MIILSSYEPDSMIIPSHLTPITHYRSLLTHITALHHPPPSLSITLTDDPDIIFTLLHVNLLCTIHMYVIIFNAHTQIKTKIKIISSQLLLLKLCDLKVN